MPQHMKLMSGAMNDVIKDFDVKEDDGSPVAKFIIQRLRSAVQNGAH